MNSTLYESEYILYCCQQHADSSENSEEGLCLLRNCFFGSKDNNDCICPDSHLNSRFSKLGTKGFKSLFTPCGSMWLCREAEKGQLPLESVRVEGAQPPET